MPESKEGPHVHCPHCEDDDDEALASVPKRNGLYTVRTVCPACDQEYILDVDVDIQVTASKLTQGDPDV